jgi:hypothetical protein
VRVQGRRRGGRSGRREREEEGDQRAHHARQATA